MSKEEKDSKEIQRLKDSCAIKDKTINCLFRLLTATNKNTKKISESNSLYRTQRILDKQENARELEEILLVDTLEDLTIEEKYNSVRDIAQYYLEHHKDKIIELEESAKQV